uniref:Uncharacterized protein n=1 Tax=Knipowitschia caucasica TaxID=637954 RepID=A0AAV2KSZ6_KNICA
MLMSSFVSAASLPPVTMAMGPGSTVTVAKQRGPPLQQQQSSFLLRALVCSSIMFRVSHMEENDVKVGWGGEVGGGGGGGGRCGGGGGGWGGWGVGGGGGSLRVPLLHVTIHEAQYSPHPSRHAPPNYQPTAILNYPPARPPITNLTPGSHPSPTHVCTPATLRSYIHITMPQSSAPTPGFSRHHSRSPPRRKKNNNPAYPDYTPSIFPQAVLKELTKSTTLDRFKRAQKRKDWGSRPDTTLRDGRIFPPRRVKSTSASFTRQNDAPPRVHSVTRRRIRTRRGACESRKMKENTGNA